MKRYLVTGGAGFIGQYLVERLLKEGNSVKIFDNLIRSHESRLISLNKYKKFSFINGDIKKYDEIYPHLDNIDCVYHLAAINGTQNFYKIPIEILDVGVQGCINIIKAADKFNVTDVILASSAEVYQNASIVPTDETISLSIPDPLNPRYSYGLSKIFSEVYALNYKFNGNTRVKIFRPHNIYGPDMGYKHVIPEFIMNLESSKNNSSFSPKGDISTTRAFCYVSDLIDGLKILEKINVTNEIFHIGNDFEISILDLLKLIRESMSLDIQINEHSFNEHEGSALRRCPDINKMKKLGYLPKVSLEKGLKHTIDWYLNNKKIEKEYI